MNGNQVANVNFTGDPQTQINSLSSSLDTTNTNLQNEISARQSADTNLEGAINDEISARQNADDLKSEKDASNLSDPNVLAWQNKLNNMTSPILGQVQQNKQAVVVESYISSDGLTWYRKWSDGWKECGGSFASNNVVSIVFPIQFSNANYSATGSCVASSNTNTIIVPKFYDRTVTGMNGVNMYMNYTNGNVNVGTAGERITWEAKGY